MVWAAGNQDHCRNQGLFTKPDFLVFIHFLPFSKWQTAFSAVQISDYCFSDGSVSRGKPHNLDLPQLSFYCPDLGGVCVVWTRKNSSSLNAKKNTITLSPGPRPLFPGTCAVCPDIKPWEANSSPGNLWDRFWDACWFELTQLSACLISQPLSPPFFSPPSQACLSEHVPEETQARGQAEGSVQTGTETVSVEKLRQRADLLSRRLKKKASRFSLLYLFFLNRLFITVTKGNEQLLCRLHSAAQPHQQ